MSQRGAELKETGLARWGMEHPDEVFEFARFCLLNHYARDEGFVAEVEGLASRHRHTLDAVAAQQPSRSISALADYRVAWGLLSFLARGPASGKSSHSLEGLIDTYRSELSAFAEEWGLAAQWCAPSLHVALLAPIVFPGNFPEPDKRRPLVPLFTWDLQRQGPAPYDTLVTLPRLLLHSDAPGRNIEFVLLRHAGEPVYYDPRMDRWEDVLARARGTMGRKRLSCAVRDELLKRRLEIEGALLTEGYAARRKPRRLAGRHALARWTHWKYLAICPPKRTTAQILDFIGSYNLDASTVDHAIAYVLKLLQLPGRPARLT